MELSSVLHCLDELPNMRCASLENSYSTITGPAFTDTCFCHPDVDSFFQETIYYFHDQLIYALVCSIRQVSLIIFNWLFQVNAAAEIIYDLVDPNANLIFGAVIDPSLSGQVSLSLFFLYLMDIDSSFIIILLQFGSLGMPMLCQIYMLMFFLAGEHNLDCYWIQTAG